jgi:hypothetical protein
MASTLNILILVLTVGSIEILVRTFSVQTLGGETIRGVPLAPRKWSEVVIDYYDTTACLIKKKAFDEYMPHAQYSPTANAVIAKCLEPIVRKEISQLTQ